ncbi:MAG: CBS domain-containing protein [Gammaproteobacteria bacterium]|nr:CBS domain-containing protein [Gammaproteobacteria bacterium]MDE0450973.1 CBS domain-containing protein [Gammaproteobacteria bacterium]
MSEQREARVEDVMVTDLYNINGLASVGEAIQMMKKHRVSSLVVDRRDADDEVGLVEVADVANEVIARNRAPDRVSVYEVMTKPVVTLPPGMLVRYAVRLLARLGHSRAVVVDDARNAVGMVTLRDLVLGPRED